MNYSLFVEEIVLSWQKGVLEYSLFAATLAKSLYLRQCQNKNSLTSTIGVSLGHENSGELSM